MNTSFFELESNEQDLNSQGLFHMDEDNQMPDNENLFQFDIASDEFKNCKNEQQQDPNTSTKKQTPLDQNPFWNKDEESWSPFKAELNTHSYIDPLLEVRLGHEEQEEEIQNNTPVAVEVATENQKQPIQNPPSPKNKFIAKKKTQTRIDYLVKKTKVAASKKMTNHANSLLIPLKKKFFKLSKPNSKEYTSITKSDKNRAWLGFKIKEIFVLGKDTESGSLQKNNWEVIKKIEELEEDEIIKKIKEFLEMTLEDFYTLIFFDSKEFKEFTEDKEIIRLDEEFQRQRGESIREKSIFIKFIKNY